jgi:hypothetical protein
MNPWETVVSIALTGTERQPLNLPTEGSVGQLLAKLDPNDTEKSLLSAAATLSLHQKAGQPLQQTQSIQTPCELDDLPGCSQKVGYFLQQILKGEYPQLLPELLTTLATVGQRVPAECLPALLDLGCRQTELYPLIQSVMGKRGHWLAQQNPDWQYYEIKVDQLEQAWITLNNTQQRRVLLEQFRQVEPAKAREFLASIWRQEKADDRKIFLETLQINLTLEDESFLEIALDDRSKQVRLVAANLLSKLPTSKLCQRMTQRIPNYIELIPAVVPRIEITLPTECNQDKAMVRDGMTADAPYLMPLEVWWLQQMIAATPLSTWEKSSLKPIEILRAAKADNTLILKDSEQKDCRQALLDGWAKAAIRQQNMEWIEAFLATDTETCEKILKVMPAQRQEAELIRRFESNSSNFLLTGRVYAIQCQFPWSEKLSRSFLQTLRRYQTHYSRYYQEIYQDIQFLETVIYYLNGAVLSELQEFFLSVIQEPSCYYYWVTAINKMLSVLQFRSQMLVGNR